MLNCSVSIHLPETTNDCLLQFQGHITSYKREWIYRMKSALFCILNVLIVVLLFGDQIEKRACN